VPADDFSHVDSPRSERGPLSGRSIEIAAILVWLAYSALWTVLLTSESYDVEWLTILSLPAALALGWLSPRPLLLLLPGVVAFGLGAVAYSIACPCYEDTLEAYIFWWLLFFSLPSTVALGVGMAIRGTARRNAA
jgi:hypothetical protein